MRPFLNAVGASPDVLPLYPHQVKSAQVQHSEIAAQ
jgi:hypothetical protein